MTDALSAQFAAAWATTNWIEILAAVLAAGYLLLAIKQLRSCWAAAFLSSCLYVWILFGARLYMESALNTFYAAMAAYGYWQWTRGAGGAGVRVSRWSFVANAMGVAAVIAASLASSFFLRRFTQAAWPFLDSMVTWASVVATLLVARKVYENWYWWLVIDTLSLCLYLNRHLYLTAALFAFYLGLIVVGMREWRRDLPSADHGTQFA